MDDDKITPRKIKTVFMVPFFWEGRIKFIQFKSETYEEALLLAKCMFGDRAAKYLYKKEIPIED
jgi:hypothetical protein